jgi:hypothetical protein
MSLARVGINIGISLTHARSVLLVLSLKTGLASPQFHVKHDNLFETTDLRAGRFGLPKSRWQALDGLTKKITVLIPRQINSTREKTQRLIGTPAGGHAGGAPDRRVTNGPRNEAASITSDNAGRAATDESAEENGDGLNDDEHVVLEGEQDMTPPSDSPPTTRSGRKI